jgi:mannitol/fructose-specific phosphotransferase system IIA component (Ntr-type)
MDIWKELNSDAIRLDIDAGTKEEIFNVLVEALVITEQVDPALPALEEVLRREAVLSTGVGNGVALPHARLENYTGFALAFGRPLEPLDVDAVDRQPADLFFMLLADKNDPGTIVKILGRLARLCDDESVRKELRKAGTPAAVIKVVRNSEGS